MGSILGSMPPCQTINNSNIVTYGARQVATSIVRITNSKFIFGFEHKFVIFSSHFAVFTYFFIKIIKITLPKILVKIVHLLSV